MLAGLASGLLVNLSASPTVAQEASPPAEATEARRVDILNYRVEGNTVLSRLDIERAVYPFLGPKRPTDDVENARAALEKAYRDKGYETVGVEVPEQDVRGGVVRLNVTELRVGQLQVTGSRFFSPEAIKARAPSLAEGQTPNYRDVSRDIVALNKSADRTVTPALRAGTAPGTVDVDLQVEDRLPVRASVELNDRNSSRTERLRASASVSYTNLFQREHSLSLQGQFTPEDPEQSSVLSGSYLVPFLGTPWSLIGYAVHSDSDVAAVGGIGVIGAGDIVGARGAYTAQAGTYTHQFLFGIDYKDFNEDLVLGSDTASTPIDYAPLLLQYSLNRRTELSSLDLGVGLNVGLRGLGADDREFDLKRNNASASWSYLTLNGAYVRTLPMNYRASLKVSGQIAGAPLISNEQFSAGGLDSVRGYYESQELGDYGIAAQLDLESPSLHPFTRGLADDWIFFVFADAAYLGVHDPLPDLNGVAQDSAGLSSVGLGTRLRVLGRLNAMGLLAAPLAERDETLIDFGYSLRGQFRVWVEF